MTRKAVAAVVLFHLCVTAFVYAVGRGSLAPHLFNAQGVLAADSQVYQSQAAMLADLLARSGFGAWFFALLPLHVKLYSLCFAVSGRWLGASVLSVWPLNAAYFVAVLYLVYKLGREVFGRETAVLAAAMVGLWPTFLLSTTQLMRDPLFIAAALLFLFFNVRWLTRTYAVRGALAVAGLGMLTECVLWLSRSDAWELMSGVALMTCAALCARMVGERKVFWGNAAGAALLLVASLLIPRVAAQFYKPAYGWAQARGVAFVDYGDALDKGARAGEPSNAGAARPGESNLPARISALRERFIEQYPDAGSNIDTGVRFESASDVLRHLPRALAVGLFAPFPQMWFATGAQMGRAGRIVAAFEMSCLYLIELLALVGLWHSRRQLSAWFLLAVSLAGALALGLVVTNVGALYRMRYAFVVPLVMLGSEGLRRVIRRARSEDAGREGEEPRPVSV